MPADIKKIPEMLNGIVHKLGSADKAVLEPYISQLSDLVASMKKSGQANLQTNMEKMLEMTEKIKKAKVGDLPGFHAGINMIQSILKEKTGK